MDISIPFPAPMPEQDTYAHMSICCVRNYPPEQGGQRSHDLMTNGTGIG